MRTSPFTVRVSTTLFVCVALCGCQPSGNFELIADYNTAAPGGGHFSVFDNYAFDGTNVAFGAADTQYATGAIFRWYHGAPQILLIMAPGQNVGSDQLDVFGAGLVDIDNAQIAAKWLAKVSGTDYNAIIVGDSPGTMDVAADDSGSYLTADNDPIVQIFSNPNVSFGKAVYVAMCESGDGGLILWPGNTKLIDNETIIPGSGGATFVGEDLYNLRMSGNYLVFGGNDPASIYAAVYLADISVPATPVISMVVSTNSTVPGLGGTFRTYSRFDLYGGEAVFIGGPESKPFGGVYSFSSGVLGKVVDVNDTVPGKNIQFSGFGNCAIYGDTILFDGYDSEGSGIFSKQGSGPVTKVIYSGDTIVTGVEFVDGAVQAGCFRDYKFACSATTTGGQGVGQGLYLGDLSSPGSSALNHARTAIGKLIPASSPMAAKRR